MTSDPLAGVDPRILGAQLRGAREARGWTRQQLAESLGVAGETVEAVERGERRLEPRELMAISSLLGRRVSDLLQGWRVAKEPAAHSPDDKPFSSRYCVLAIEAWQREELSEGQLARILCTDRVGAREAIERFQAVAQETKETREGWVNSQSRQAGILSDPELSRAVQAGLEEADQGRLVSHEEVWNAVDDPGDG